MKRKLIGQLLIEEGKLDEKALKKALDIKKQAKNGLGRYL